MANRYIFHRDETEDDLFEHLHRVYRPGFLDGMQHVLARGLGERLARVLVGAPGEPPVRILDAGCGEGLQLHEVAATLEQRGVPAEAMSGDAPLVQLEGVDLNASAIETARARAATSTPPRPYLRFRVHDLSRPFEGTYDLIYVHFVAGHIPGARACLERWYRALRPGGFLFLTDAVLREGDDGWRAPHPLLQPFLSFATEHLVGINAGIVAEEAAGWFGTLGAEVVRREHGRAPIGGTDEPGRAGFRLAQITAEGLAPLLVAAGRMTPVEVEASLASLARVPAAEASGQSSFIATTVRRPCA